MVRAMHIAFGAKNVQAVADPILSRLLRHFGQVFSLWTRSGSWPSHAGSRGAALIVPGEYSPIHTPASGKAIFAFQDSAMIDRQLAAPLRKFPPNTITDPAAIGSELELVREQGYAVTHSQFEMGVTATAVPIDIPSPGVVFSIGVTGLEQQIFEHSPIEAYIDELRRAAVELRAAFLATWR